MKYSINVRCNAKALKMADEIYFDWRDHRAMIDYIEKYPDKTFVQELSIAEEPDYDTLKMYNDKLNGNFYLALPYAWTAYDKLQELGIKYYVTYPVNTFADLQVFADLGVSFILLAAPLTHKLDKVQQYNVPIRMCPNVQIIHPMNKTGVIGSWVRPEDVSVYEKYVDTFEFWGAPHFAETSLKIYKEDQKWPGDLTHLMPDLKVSIDSRTVPADAVTARLNCGQRCLEGGGCRICHKLEAFSRALKKAAAQKKD